MKTKNEIKSIFGSVLFEFEKEDNTITKTVLEALKNGANLSCANLSCAYLRGANLRDANLRDANLRDANLRDANLSGANLIGANLSDANLSCANLSDANLSDANLSGANLRDANLRDANLSEGTAFLLPQCPSEGSFIAWKKCNNHIVKLQITENAKRSSATTLKCRCSEALVLDIQTKEGSSSNIQKIQSDRDSEFIYEIGKISSVSDFDDDRWNECSTGIHFFISREMAVKYNS